MDLAVETVDQELRGFDAGAGETLGQNVRAKHHERTGLGQGKRRPDSRGVGADEVPLERLEVGRADPDVGEISEPCVHPVHDLAPRDRAIDHRARCLHGRDGGGAESDRRAPRDRGELGQGEIASGEGDFGVSWGQEEASLEDAAPEVARGERSLGYFGD